MKEIQLYGNLLKNSLRGLFLLFSVLTATNATSQIIINGNIYGGGNMGEVGGNTKVILNGVEL